MSILKLFQIALVTSVFYFIWINESQYIPSKSELEVITGELIQATEYIEPDLDDFQNNHTLLKIKNGNLIRSVVSHDLSILSKISEGQFLEAKVWRNKNINYLWELRANNLVVTTTEATSDLITKRERGKLFFALAIYTAIILSIILEKKDNNKI